MKAEMDQKDPVELLREMLEIYSPSGKEEKLASYLGAQFGRLGFEQVWTDKVGNIYGAIGAGSPTFLLCGHMDTVPGWIPVKTTEGRIYGRGAVDAKASLGAMILAALSLKSEMRSGRVIVAGVVDEEGEARGIRQLMRERLKADCAVFGEPSGVRNVTFAYKGKLGLKVTCKTVSGHVGAQHLLSNSIERAFEFWGQLKAACRRHESPSGVFYSLTPCLTRTSSQRTSGGVPDLCTMDIDLRLPPKMMSEEVLELVKEVGNGFQMGHQDLSVYLKVTDRVEPFVAKRDTRIMMALKEAITEVTGEHMKFLRKTGTGDMNVFGAATGVPVATYGPGDSSLSHTSCEYIDISEYLASIKVYKRTIEKILP